MLMFLFCDSLLECRDWWRSLYWINPMCVCVCVALLAHMLSLICSLAAGSKDDWLCSLNYTLGLSKKSPSSTLWIGFLLHGPMVMSSCFQCTAYNHSWQPMSKGIAWKQNDHRNVGLCVFFLVKCDQRWSITCCTLHTYRLGGGSASVDLAVRSAICSAQQSNGGPSIGLREGFQPWF